QAPRIEHRDEEDAPTLWAERSRLKVELQAVQVAITQAAKIDAPTAHQVLLHRPDPVVAIVEVVEAFERAAQALAGTVQDIALKEAAITGADQVAVTISRAWQFPIAEWRVVRLTIDFGAQIGAKVREVVEMR